jgi:hypothetical protein
LKVSELALTLALAVAFVNPYTENAEGTSAFLFMLSHYALYVAGLIVGYRVLRLPLAEWTLILVGVIPALVWHLPAPFALSAKVFQFRILEESTLFAGGVILGSGIRRAASWLRVALFGLWVAGDTGISLVFVAKPELYATGSPYTSSGIVLTGIAMVFLMNILVALVLYAYFRSVTTRLSKERVKHPSI